MEEKRKCFKLTFVEAEEKEINELIQHLKGKYDNVYLLVRQKGNEYTKIAISQDGLIAYLSDKLSITISAWNGRGPVNLNEMKYCRNDDV